MVIYRLYTNTLVTYEYMGARYDVGRVINMECTIFLFTYHFTCVRVMSSVGWSPAYTARLLGDG